MLRKLLLVSVPVISSLILGLAVSPPAQALDQVLFDPGADGQGEDDELLVVACTDRVFAFAPIPTKENGFSSFEQLQLGWVEYTLQHGASTFSQTSASDWPAMDQLGIRFDTPYDVGDTVNLTLKADKGGGYATNQFNFSTTVIDSSFNDGSGTASDPYVISSKADLNKMRCYDNAYFELSQDIDMSGKWLPIGVNTFDNNLRWSGFLDGNGHSIENFEVDYPTMRGVGLFGSTNNTQVRDLDFNSPSVTGSRDVGVLIGYAERTGVSKIEIQDAEVQGFHSVGILMGKKNWGGIVSGISIEGSIQATQYAYQSSTQLEIVGPREIGGLIGFDDGGGSGSTNIAAVVDIDILAEANFVALAAANSPSLTPIISQNVTKVGGLYGDTDQDSTFSYFNVDSDINIEIFGKVEEVGGVIGESESALFHVDVDSAINIVHLGVASLNGFTEDIGGAVGATDEHNVNFANVNSAISIAQASGSNNGLEINAVGTEQNVRRVGVMGGYWNDIQYDSFNRVETDISVESPDAQQIAGYVGSADNFHAFGVTNLVVSGNLEVIADSASGIAGFTNLISSARINGDLVIAAVSVSVSDENATNVGPFLGIDSNPELNRLAYSFWDSTLNADANANNYPLGASTAQLQNQSFLAGIGFDFDNIWQVSSGYPELRPGIYSWGCGCGSGQGSAGSGSASAAPSRPYEGPTILSVTRSALAGAEARVTGTKLNSIGQVLVNGQSTSFRLNSDGSLAFTVPNLAPGVYAVVFEIPIAQTNLTSSIEIAGSAAVETEKVLNAGSFNGYVAVYAKGYAGSELTWKIAGKWFKTKLTDDYHVFQRTTIYVNFPINVELYIDGKRLFQKNVLTR